MIEVLLPTCVTKSPSGMPGPVIKSPGRILPAQAAPGPATFVLSNAAIVVTVSVDAPIGVVALMVPGAVSR